MLLLAAGGADVRFTYHQGAADADDLVARVPAASAFRLDVHDLGAGLDAVLADGWRPTHVAYMATPPIFDGMRGVYSESLYDRLREVYVDRFLELLDRLDADQLSGVLWPSTVAVEGDVPGLAEYADAKRAGEAACARLAAEHPSLRDRDTSFPQAADRSDDVVRPGRVRRHHRRAARRAARRRWLTSASTVHLRPCQTP